MDTLKFLMDEIAALTFADKLRLFAILSSAILNDIGSSKGKEAEQMREATDKFLILLEKAIQANLKP